MINLLSPIQEPIRIIQSFGIIIGFWVCAKLLLMIKYEIKYYRDAGEDYINYGKEYVILQNKIRSNGNKGIKK